MAVNPFSSSQRTKKKEEMSKNETQSVWKLKKLVFYLAFIKNNEDDYYLRDVVEDFFYRRFESCSRERRRVESLPRRTIIIFHKRHQESFSVRLDSFSNGSRWRLVLQPESSVKFRNNVNETRTSEKLTSCQCCVCFGETTSTLYFNFPRKYDLEAMSRCSKRKRQIGLAYRLFAAQHIETPWCDVVAKGCWNKFFGRSLFLCVADDDTSSLHEISLRATTSSTRATTSQHPRAIEQHWKSRRL